MNEKRLVEIEVRVQAATAGEWIADGSVIFTTADSGKDHIAYCNYGVGRERCNANAEFIAHAREDIPDLIAEVAEMRKAGRELLLLIEEHGSKVLLAHAKQLLNIRSIFDEEEVK